MKKVLSSLLAIAFLESQALAIRGGPDYGGNGTFSTVGTYSGVMVVRSETNRNTTNGGTAGAIGLFSLGVPASGIANGDAVVFVDGTAYNGNIIGFVDPNSDILDGIVEATSDYQIQFITPSGAIGTANIFAQGNIQTSITRPFAPTGLETLVTTGILIQGTATLDLFSQVNADGTPDVSNSVVFNVDGIQQSSTVTTSTLSFNLNTSSSGS